MLRGHVARFIRSLSARGLLDSPPNTRSAEVRGPGQTLAPDLTQAWLSGSRRWFYRLNAPRVPKSEITPPSGEQIERLLDTANAGKDRFGPLWTVAAYSGCREGEVLGL